MENDAASTKPTAKKPFKPQIKKGEAKKKHIVHGIQEPVRISAYDIVKDSLKAAKHKTFIHSIVYIGEHSFPRSNIVTVMQKNVEDTNKSYVEERITGFLLAYTRYFVHAVTGSEDAINKHLKLLFETESNKKYLGRTKFLIQVSHIRRRLIDTWLYYEGAPATLLDQMDRNCDMETTNTIVFYCLKKIYEVFRAFIGENKADNSDAEEEESVMTESASLMSALITRKEKYNLPENELLDFLLSSKYVIDLEFYYKLYGNVPQRDIYKDRVYPVPSDFVPFDIFDKPYDPLVDLQREDLESIGKEAEDTEDIKTVVDIPADTTSFAVRDSTDDSTK